MKLKKWVSMVLAAGMLASLAAGCGGNSENANQPQQQQEPSDAAAEPGEETKGNEPAGQEEMADEPAEITVALRTLGTVEESGYAAVQEAINEITESKINVTVHLQWIDSASYGTQVPMMITGNEPLDLMMFTPNPSTTFNTMMAQGQLMDITDLVQEYGPAIQETLGDDLLAATSKDGKVYGVGTYGPLGQMVYIFIIRDYLEQVDMLEKAENCTTWTELEEILKAVADATGQGLVNSDVNGGTLLANPGIMAADDFADNYVYDNVGDAANLFMGNTETGKIECLYFNEDVKTVLKRAADWYEKGLIYKDAATAQDFGTTLMKNGVGAALATCVEVGGESEKIAAVGKDMVVIKAVANPMATTGVLTKFGFGIPVTATEPEAAMKFLNLLYTDGEISTLLSWGIEGRDYVLKEDGTATYPEGVSSDNCLYHIADFLYGSRINTVPWEGAGADIRDVQRQQNETIEISPFLGFNVDNSQLEQELTAVVNVFEQYKGTVLSGASGADFDSYYQEFLDALTAAGIQELIDAYQQQLDDWVAANK